MMGYPELRSVQSVATVIYILKEALRQLSDGHVAPADPKGHPDGKVFLQLVKHA